MIAERASDVTVRGERPRRRRLLLAALLAPLLLLLAACVDLDLTWRVDSDGQVDARLVAVFEDGYLDLLASEDQVAREDACGLLQETFGLSAAAEAGLPALDEANTGLVWQEDPCTATLTIAGGSDDTAFIDAFGEVLRPVATGWQYVDEFDTLLDTALVGGDGEPQPIWAGLLPAEQSSPRLRYQVTLPGTVKDHNAHTVEVRGGEVTFGWSWGDPTAPERLEPVEGSRAEEMYELGVLYAATLFDHRQDAQVRPSVEEGWLPSTLTGDQAAMLDGFEEPLPGADDAPEAAAPPATVTQPPSALPDPEVVPEAPDVQAEEPAAPAVTAPSVSDRPSQPGGTPPGSVLLPPGGSPDDPDLDDPAASSGGWGWGRVSALLLAAVLLTALVMWLRGRGRP